MSYVTRVDCATLSEHLDDPDWRILDCRHQLSDPDAGSACYAAGHLPGAFFLHLDRDLSGEKTGHNGRHPLPDPRRLADTLGKLGISSSVQVVAYDDTGGMIAGRLWWLLRWLGHDRVAVLDGGIDRWLVEKRPLSRVEPGACATDLAIAVRENMLAHTCDLLTDEARRAYCLVDARSPDRFRGENETLDPVGGHIPGARNRFFRDNLDADGCFRSPDELRQDFLALLAGKDPRQVVMSCGSGVSACHNLLAMEIAGLPGARLYAGSWSEWCSDPARPVERQTAP